MFSSPPTKKTETGVKKSRKSKAKTPAKQSPLFKATEKSKKTNDEVNKDEEENKTKDTEEKKTDTKVENKAKDNAEDTKKKTSSVKEKEKDEDSSEKTGKVETAEKESASKKTSAKKVTKKRARIIQADSSDDEGHLLVSLSSIYLFIYII